MLRRDVFVDRYSAINNEAKLEITSREIEEFVDSQLVESRHIINMINQDQIDMSQNVTITEIIENASIHNDNTVSSTAGRRGGTDNVEFAIWKGPLKTTDGEDAATTSWNDKTLSTTVTGSISIILPENTNKNAAMIAVDRYLGPEDTSNLTTKDPDVFGFWRKIPLIDGTGDTIDDPTAVQLEWDSEIKRFKIIFKLNP